jgi:hypothetical protein
MGENGSPFRGPSFVAVRTSVSCGDAAASGLSEKGGHMNKLMLPSIALACALLLGGSMLRTGGARADVPGPITTRVDTILSAAGGTTGLYLKGIGGPVIAAKNETFAFEPASSIKVLLHLYAHVQVQAGNAAWNDQVTLYAGASGSCPNGAAVLGTEDLEASDAKMMRVSDNPATRANWEHWTPVPQTINNYAAGLGLAQTTFPNYVGCQVQGSQTVDDNTTSLTDLGTIYEGVADSSLISGAVRDHFYDNMSGRQQFEQFNFDFTGIWPKLLTMTSQEAPAGMPASLLQDFQDGMTANHKGGSYGKCLDNACNTLREYLSFAGWAQFPTCESQSFSSKSYVWGIFIQGADDPNYNGGGPNYVTPAENALGAAAAEPLREQMHDALAGWGACYPPDVTVTTTPAAPPAGQDGYFNAADLAANGGSITVNVSATDDSGVTDLLCTDNGNPVAVLNQSGSNPRTGSFPLSSDGTHQIECEATDGMTPPNTGASAGSQNTATVKIDGTAPTVACDGTPVFVLNGPGGDVTATVTDLTSGPVDTSISAPADVSVAGAHTIDLTGYDHAGNATTVACPYIVSYLFLGFSPPPLPKPQVKAGSTVPVKFMLGDANGVPISDAEAQALSDACEVRIFFTGGDPSPNCVEYKAGANRFQFELPIPQGVSGLQTITVRVYDGAVVINEESTDVLVF